MARKDESPSFGRFHVGLAVFCPRSDRKSTEKRTFWVFLGGEPPLGETPTLETASHRPGTARAESIQKLGPFHVGLPSLHGPQTPKKRRNRKLKKLVLRGLWRRNVPLRPPRHCPSKHCPQAAQRAKLRGFIRLPPRVAGLFSCRAMCADFADFWISGKFFQKLHLSRKEAVAPPINQPRCADQ